MKRRDFLRQAGAFIVAAKLLPACGDNKQFVPEPDGAKHGVFAFPQGVASGDPRTTSVVLWTRVVQNSDPGADVPLVLQLSTTEDFATLVSEPQDLVATAASDHTVRVLVTDLTANTTVFYRFVAGVDEIAGRTRTAPDANADVQVNVAWVSCQDYQSGHFGAYRQMIKDDDERAEADRIHFVVHLGDVIYETIDEQSQRALTDDFDEITLEDHDGGDRIVARFPSGGGPESGARFARTASDYRHLYKTFFSDPNLQAARAKWPFVYTWDDHEFTNDYWQSMANYVEGTTQDEPSQSRKYNANQAWFEYIPVHLSGAPGVTGVTQDAKDFTPASVTDARFTAPNADNFVDEPNNVAAIGSMTIYRSLRWGKHVELVMTDERSYRSDHAIPEDLAALINVAAGDTVFFDPRNFLPKDLVKFLDVGSLSGSATLPPPLNAIANPRRASAIGTMLGKAQKAWWKATMQSSDATWKLWGNEVPLTRLLVKNNGQALGIELGFDRVLDGDAWDGYPTERLELLTFLRVANIKNVVALSGDIHAHFAGVLVDDFDAGSPTAVATELVSAGISSNSLFSFYEHATRGLAPRPLVTVDASGNGGPAFTENLNLLITKGLVSAATFAGAIGQGAPFAVARGAALQQQDPNINTHLRYVDTNAQGYGYAKITADEIAADLVTINRPIGNPSTNAPGIKRTASFTIPKDNPGGMSAATVTGTKPFPL